MNNLDHLMRSFVHANEQRKQQSVQHAVPAKQNTQQVQKVDDNLITHSDNVVTTSKINTTKLLSDEEYKVSIITLAINHIKKKWSNA